MTALPPPETVKELAQKALQANKDHQYALKIYTERLEAELEAVDKLLAASDLPDDDIEVDAGGTIVVPGAVKAMGLIPYDSSIENHPFAEDAEKRQRYLQATVIHQMKAPELETLAEAVRAENYRIYALDAQRCGQQVFLDPEAKPDAFLNTNKVGINWERVASKVSAAGSSNVKRTAQECEIRWLGDRHPEFNHSPWSQEETARVKELIGDGVEGQVDWVDIASELGTHRTPLDCMRHAIPRRSHVWTPGSDRRLMEAVQIYGTGSWMLVARHVSEDATASQCQNRYIRSLDPNHKRGTWSEEEDAQLRRAVEVFGRSWVEVCTFVPTRSSEQCRDRWQEVLNPGSGRGRWDGDEDKALLAAYKTVGEGRWKEISLIVGNGRTDNMCRHRYSALMKRQAKAVSTPATASPTPAPDMDITPITTLDQSPAGPSGQQHQELVNPVSLPPETSEPVSQQATQVNELDITPMTQEPDASVPVLNSKPRPKPRPRRRVTPAETVPAKAAGADDAQVTPGNVFVDINITQLESEAAQVTESDVQPAPKRRGRPRKIPKRNVEDSEDTGPSAKKIRTSIAPTETAIASGSTQDVNSAESSTAAAEREQASNPIYIKSKGRSAPARNTAEPTRRSARRQSHNQPTDTLAGDQRGDVPHSDTVVSTNTPDATPDSEHRVQSAPVGLKEQASSSTNAEPSARAPEDLALQLDVSKTSRGSQLGKRGKSRGKTVLPVTTRTLRSTSRRETHSNHEDQEAYS